MQAIPWDRSLEIFSAGFGGVFICLSILFLFVKLFSIIIVHIEKSAKDEEKQNSPPA